MRKKQKKKESKSDLIFDIEEVIGGVSEMNVENDKPHTIREESTSAAPATTEVLLKRIRALRKKIKQIEDLETKLDSGEILEKEQLEKISKKDSFMEELSTLTA